MKLDYQTREKILHGLNGGKEETFPIGGKKVQEITYEGDVYYVIVGKRNGHHYHISDSFEKAEGCIEREKYFARINKIKARAEREGWPTGRNYYAARARGRAGRPTVYGWRQYSDDCY
jgi:hypothetical protein